MTHSHPAVDRCCKLPSPGFTFDGIDEFLRIPCDIDKASFGRDYVERRRVVMLIGCDDNWPAKNWTIEGLLKEYPEVWKAEYQDLSMNKSVRQLTEVPFILELLKKKAPVKIFQMIFKTFLRGKIPYTEKQAQELKLGLLTGFSQPPMIPEDLFAQNDIDNNQAYVMMGTRRTGSGMHIDPAVTDAYNACIFGHKWWTYLPKDLYEFKSDWSCDQSCSDKNVLEIYNSEAWYNTIYPQIRSRMFYGDFIKSGLQRPGETLYMPHFIHHSVYNIDTNLAVGENLFFSSAVEEAVFSMRPEKMNLLNRRLGSTEMGHRMRVVGDQLKKAAKKYGLLSVKSKIADY